MSGSTYRRPSFGMATKPSLVNQLREKERFELSTLNDKFADYVEKVRYLEAQNKQIQMDTNVLTEKEQENCLKIKTLFETELKHVKDAAQQLFENKNLTYSSSQEAQNALTPLKQTLNQTHKDIDSTKHETEKVEKQLSTVEGDILMYKRRIAYQDDEHTQWKQFTTQIQRLLLQAKNEIHNESSARTTSEQTVKQLRQDVSQLREQQQQKLKDLARSALVLSPTPSNERAHMFKSELSTAIRQIRDDFEKQNDLLRNELYKKFTQSYDDICRQYPELAHLFLNDREQERIKQEEERVRLDIQRIRSDSQLIKQKNSELKLHIRELQINIEMSQEEDKRIQELQQKEINQFKIKHEKITKNYEEVITKQITLEKEIETYRNLLEGTMKPVVDHITEEYNTMTANQVRGETKHGLTNGHTHAENVSQRSSPAHFTDTNEIKSYDSYMTRAKKIYPIDTATVVNDFLTATNDSNLQIVESDDDITLKNNDDSISDNTTKTKK